MDKATLLKTLVETRAAWEALLDEVSEKQMQQPGAAGKWSVKDIIAHVTWGESEIAPVLTTHILAGSELWQMTDDERNEIMYQRNKSRSLPEIIDEERQAYTALLAAVQALSDEDLSDARRFEQMPQEWQPWQLIAGNSFQHYEDHMPSIREWLTRNS